MYGRKTEGLFLNKNQSPGRKQTNKQKPTYGHISTSFSKYLIFSYKNQSETQRKLFKVV